MQTLFLWLSLFSADPRQELLDADRAFDRETAARGLDGWMSFFAPDAKLNTAKGVIEGSAALREYYSAMFAQTEFSIRWQPLHAEASKDGTLGYTFGAAEISYKNAQGATVKRAGRYLTVWRRMPDGGWKAVTDLGS